MNGRIAIINVSIFLSFVFPIVAHANILITEIMYDLEGADTGREWIEIYNTGSDEDISLWRLREAEINHKISFLEGESTIIPSNSVAVIADNREKFLLDWPGYTGPVFDSSFSLNNSGEELSLINPDAEVDINILYNTELGGAGDGDTLQYSDGAWSVGTPTPGMVEDESSSTPDTLLGQDVIDEDADSGAWQPPDIKYLTAYAKGDSVAVAGAEVFVTGYGFGFKGEPLETARYVWNFGDGGIAEGERASHTYVYPGNYVIFLDVASGKYAATARIDIQIVSADIAVAGIGYGADGFIELKNDSLYDLNISNWRISSDAQFFYFPLHTYIQKQQTVKFPSSRTGIVVSEHNSVELQYGNGVLVHTDREGESDAGISVVDVSEEIVAEAMSSTVNEKEFPILNSTDSSPVVAYVGGEDADEDFPTVDKKETPVRTSDDVMSDEENSQKEFDAIKWFSALGGVVGVGLFGVFFVREKKELSEKITADEIEILE